ncbi:MAG: hypothetical protein ACP5I3_12170 [Thermoproteus sp.]
MRSVLPAARFDKLEGMLHGMDPRLRILRGVQVAQILDWAEAASLRTYGVSPDDDVAAAAEKLSGRAPHLAELLVRVAVRRLLGGGC